MSAAEQIELMEIKSLLKQILAELRSRPSISAPMYEPIPYWQHPHYVPPKPGAYPRPPDITCTTQGVEYGP